MEHQGVQQALINLSSELGTGGWITVYTTVSYIAMFFVFRWMWKDESGTQTDEEKMVFGGFFFFVSCFISCRSYRWYNLLYWPYVNT